MKNKLMDGFCAMLMVVGAFCVLGGILGALGRPDEDVPTFTAMAVAGVVMAAASMALERLFVKKDGDGEDS